MTDLAVHYNIRKFQHFKTLFCRSLLLSNMQICYLVENIRQTRFKMAVFASFLPKRTYFHRGKQIDKLLQNTVSNRWCRKSLSKV